MVRASIDLGTNTCLLLVKECGPGGDRVLHDESTIVRLGEGVAQSRQLNPSAMGRAKECLIRYAGIARSLGVDPGAIVAVGTAQARDAGNAVDFFDSIESETGIRFRILSGDEEARATFLGAALPGMDSRKMVVMDIGGGSTELVAIPEGTAIFGESLGIGAVKITERFLKSDPVTDSEFWAAENAIDAMLETLKPWRKELETRISTGGLQFVAVAGTAVTLAMLQASALRFNPAEIDGGVLTRGDAHRLVEELKWRTVEERKIMLGMEPKRADVILAGALIFWRAMEVLDFREAFISTRGLRYGVLGENTA